jgi:hypothetical protein
MAKTVYNSETIELQDGTEVVLKPLAIGLLRKFMKAWSKFVDVKDEDDAFEIYINCCGVALSNEFKSTFEKPLDAEKVLSDDYREHLEGVLDMDTIFKIMDLCGGLKLNDPKLLAEVEKAAQEELGKN